jgi:hypothetical protein
VKAPQLGPTPLPPTTQETEEEEEEEELLDWGDAEDAEDIEADLAAIDDEDCAPTPDLQPRSTKEASAPQIEPVLSCCALHA